MLTTYRVTLPDGNVLMRTTLDDVRQVVEAHPGATVDPVVRYTACPQHPAYEPSNCPRCDLEEQADSPQ